jgi:steroid delta-isomerase-like uncharacterized protein
MLNSVSREHAAHLIREIVDGWNTNDPDRVVRLYAPDFIEEDVGMAKPRHGAESIRLLMRLYRRAFPDLQIVPAEVVVQDDCVTFAWELCGTHRGTLMNIPPTGRQVRVQGVSVMRLENGQVKSARRIWDLAGMLRTFGLLPEL